MPITNIIPAGLVGTAGFRDDALIGPELPRFCAWLVLASSYRHLY